MKRGKLLISADITAMREYTDNGRTGFLLQDFDRELAGVIQEIESDPDRCQKMLEEQEKLFREQFSYAVITRKLVDALQ